MFNPIGRILMWIQSFDMQGPTENILLHHSFVLTLNREKTARPNLPFKCHIWITHRPFHVWQSGGALESQCCRGDDSKQRSQSHSNGHKCPDCVWLKVSAAAGSSSGSTATDLQLLTLNVHVWFKKKNTHHFRRTGSPWRNVHLALEPIHLALLKWWVEGVPFGDSYARSYAVSGSG